MTTTATNTNVAAAGRTPWHLWLVGAVAVLWNAYGCYDYLMSQTQGDAYLRQGGMTEAQIGYYHAMPPWMTAVWAIGVWGGALGAVLLLLRRRWAFHAFVASIAAYVLSLVYSRLMSNGGQVFGPDTLVMNAVILAACAFFCWYAWRMTKAGVLR